MCEQTICRVVTSAQSTGLGAAEWSAVCSWRPCHGITADVALQSRQARTSMTARPITPAPKTATVAPLRTLAVFSTAPHPVSLRAVNHDQLLAHNSMVCICHSNSHPGTYEAVADVGGQRLDADLLNTPTPGLAKPWAAGMSNSQSLVVPSQGAEHSSPVDTPQPSSATLSRGASGSILATLSSCTTVYCENVLVPCGVHHNAWQGGGRVQEASFE